MIRSFKTPGTEDVFNGESTKAARKTCPEAIWPVAARKLDMINYAARLEDLQTPPGNELEKLRGDRKGQHSIRINDQFRICFVWKDGSAYHVEITDYH